MHAALIIPALNEQECLGQTLAELPAGLFRYVIVADTGSTDGTAAIARAHGALVSQEPERGYGATCLAALALLPADAEIVVFLQADGSEDAAEAPRLLDPIRRNEADLVLGSRPLGRPAPGALLPHQRFGNWLACTLVRLLYRHTYTDLGPFRAIRRSSLAALDLRDRNYGWTIEMQIRALQRGLRVLEVPVSYRPRRAGENKVSGHLRSSLAAGWNILSKVFSLR
ncbi:MAG: glycosyltransferase family 2 protein [Acidobacteriota bacterium]